MPSKVQPKNQQNVISTPENQEDREKTVYYSTDEIIIDDHYTKHAFLLVSLW